MGEVIHTEEPNLLVRVSVLEVYILDITVIHIAFLHIKQLLFWHYFLQREAYEILAVWMPLKVLCILSLQPQRKLMRCHASTFPVHMEDTCTFHDPELSSHFYRQCMLFDFHIDLHDEEEGSVNLCHRMLL